MTTEENHKKLKRASRACSARPGKCRAGETVGRVPRCSCPSAMKRRYDQPSPLEPP
jgi:hypothetical protein